MTVTFMCAIMLAYDYNFLMYVPCIIHSTFLCLIYSMKISSGLEITCLTN